MVKNPRAKGNRIERKAEDRLHEQGYNTARMPHTRYGDSDFFNLFDIVAMKPGAPFKLVQVKSNSPPNLEEFKKEALEITPLKHAEIEVWVRYDREGWKVRKLNRETKKWSVLCNATKNDKKVGKTLKKALNE